MVSHKVLNFTNMTIKGKLYTTFGRSQWPRRVICGSVAARLLGLRVRIPPGSWMSSCECCVLSGSGLRVGLITSLEEFYRV
jgi:hypothetical protein